MSAGEGPTAAALGYHRLTLENVPVRQNSPATWGDSVRTWEDYVADKERERLVFVGDGPENYNEILIAPYSHRFRQGYTAMQYAKIQGFIRGALSEYEDPYLVFLTFSTSTLQANDPRPPALRDEQPEPPYPRPPVDHMDELLSTWGDGVYYELNQVMEADRKRDPWISRPDWEYLYILEPTTNEGRVDGGYPHAHAAVVVDGAVEPERFESVISRHLQEAPNATGDAHEFDDSIEVKRAESLGNPGAYLFKYLGKSWDVDEMADYEKRFAALLFDQGRQRFRASNGAQRWMQRDEDESGAGGWIFAGRATEEQARELRKFEDLDDFLIATNELGLRSWLNKHRPADETDDDEPKVVRMTHEEFYAGGFERGRPMETAGTSPVGDRPPPRGGWDAGV